MRKDFYSPTQCVQLITQGHHVTVLRNGLVVGIYLGHRDGVFAREGTILQAYFSQDERSVITVSSNGSAQLWDIRGYHRRTLRQFGDSPLSKVEWNCDGRIQLTVEKNFIGSAIFP